MVLTTPFHERLAPLNETHLWSHWSGYLSAVKYQMADKFEYFAVRNAAGFLLIIHVIHEISFQSYRNQNGQLLLFKIREMWIPF